MENILSHRRHICTRFILFVCGLTILFDSTSCKYIGSWDSTNGDSNSNSGDLNSVLKQHPTTANLLHHPPNTDSDSTNLTTLRLVQVIYRHGDRTPIVHYPNDPLRNESHWPEGFSALTKKGKLMQYNLGKYLRSRYNGFLSEAYSPSEIFVQSSSADRAIMSALSNLAGLFPPTPKDPKSMWNYPEINWQPIPIQTIPNSLDNFINFKADCPRYQELKDESFVSTPLAKSINEGQTELYEYLTKHTGAKIYNFENVSDLYDTLLIQHNYNLTLPSWTQKVFPEQMASLAPLPFDSRVQVPTTEAKAVRCGPLLKQIVTNMDVRRDSAALTEGLRKGYRKAKMYMYSGHDSTSSILLGTLGAFETQFPPFASMTIVEMHELSTDSGDSAETDFYVKVFFRNDTAVPPHEYVIPNCGYPCKLDKLKELFSDVMIDGEEWKSACKSKHIYEYIVDK